MILYCNTQIDLLPFADVANVCRLSGVVVIDGHIRDLMIKNCARHVGMAKYFWSDIFLLNF